MYYLTEKIGKKLFGIAKWIPDSNQSCLALAEDCFRMHGHKLGYTQGSYIETQKNWQGMTVNAPVYQTTVSDVRKWTHIDMAKHYKHHYKMDYAEFCQRQSTIKDISKEEWETL